MNEQAPPRSIAERSLALLERILAATLETNRLLRAGRPARVATDADLDHPKGNPLVKIVPKGWAGANFKDRRMGDCSPEFLDLLADFFLWSAGQKHDAGETKFARYAEKDAMLAVGWATRLRAAAVAKANEETPPEPPADW